MSADFNTEAELSTLNIFLENFILRSTYKMIKCKIYPTT